MPNNISLISTNILTDSGVPLSAATSGTSGGAGVAGTSGSSGTSGATGLSGSSGTSGATGAAGTSGSSGLSRTAGTSGGSGSSGTSGANGAAGGTGPTGPTGPSGTSNVYATAMNQYVNTNSNPSFGTIYASGEVYAYYSDDRLKDRIGEIKSATDKIMSLDAFYYIANELAKQFGYTDNKIEVGLSAQQIKSVMPETVSLAPFDRNQDTGESLSGENYITVNYAKLVTLLVAGFKEQQKEIEELKRK
jgi:hypothetical protein